jgi:large-conductance mechanosensitive channel
MKTLAINSFTRLRFIASMIILAVLVTLPSIVSAQTADLFDTATTEVNDLTTKYKALLQLIFGGLVIATVVFALVRKGAKKATG